MLKRLLSVITALAVVASLFTVGTTGVFAKTSGTMKFDEYAGTVHDLTDEDWYTVEVGSGTGESLDTFTLGKDGSNQYGVLARPSGATKTPKEQRFFRQFTEVGAGGIAELKLKIDIDDFAENGANPVGIYIGSKKETVTARHAKLTLRKNSGGNQVRLFLPSGSDNVSGDKAAEVSNAVQTGWNDVTLKVNNYNGYVTAIINGKEMKGSTGYDTSSRTMDAVGVYLDANTGFFGSVKIDDISLTKTYLADFTWKDVTGYASTTLGAEVKKLPTTYEGMYIQWSSTGISVDANGVVTHPEGGAVTGSLTAAFYKDEELTTPVAEPNTVTFADITITDESALGRLTWSTIGNGQNINAVSSKLNLSNEFTWASSAPGVIGTDGTVTQSAFDCPVVLTATIGEDSKSFLVNVASTGNRVAAVDMDEDTLPAGIENWESIRGSYNESQTWSAHGDTTYVSTVYLKHLPKIIDGKVKNTENKVLEIDGAVNGNNQVLIYRKLDGVSVADGKIVSFNFYPSVSDANIRIVDTNNKMIAGLAWEGGAYQGYDYTTVKVRGYGYTGTGTERGTMDLTDQNNTYREIAVNQWHNISMYLDWTGRKAYVYLDGKYIGYSNLTNNAKVEGIDDTPSIGYLGIELVRSGYRVNNPSSWPRLTAVDSAVSYFDNFSVQTAAADYEVIEGYNLTTGTLKLRNLKKSANKAGVVIAARYDANGMLEAKVQKIAANDPNLELALTGLDLNAAAGETVKVFLWSVELEPLEGGIIYETIAK